MGDDFRSWGLKDAERLSALMAAEVAWIRDCRHSTTEDIANERARTRELSEALLKFNNERLAGNGGTFWGEALTPPPTITLEKVVTNAFVETVLKDRVPDYGGKISRITYDANYYLCSKQGVSVYLGWSTINRIPYEADRHDCDNYAMEVYGEFSRVYHYGNIGVVIDWSSAHAYSFAVFADGDLWWIEPQSDQRVLIGKAPHKLENALLII